MLLSCVCSVSLYGAEEGLGAVSLPAHLLAALLLHHPQELWCQVFMQSRDGSLAHVQNPSISMLKCSNCVTEQNVLVGLTLRPGTNELQSTEEGTDSICTLCQPENWERSPGILT